MYQDWERWRLVGGVERGGEGMNWETRESKRGGGTKKGGTRSSEGRKRVQPKTMDKREEKKAKKDVVR